MPISNLHDEILQITFEFGTLLQQQDQPHFGSLVSHVTRRWRRTALATPLLWTKILFEKNTYGSAYPERQIDRAAAFLARSMPLPVDVDIEGVEEEDFDHSDDAAPAFLQLIIIHIGRCRRLNITDGDRQGMAVINILTYIPFQAAPILNSIKVGHNYDETWGPKRPLFQLGAPHLMTADIEGISIPSIPDFLSNLQHLTSLRISVTFNQDIPGATYNKLRDSLMALPSLNHLDLTIHDIFMDMEPRLPIILPTLHFLQLDGDGEGATSIVHSIQADYLIALSLEQWEVIDTEDTFNDRTESQFPSLEHLVLNKDMPDLDAFARSLPKVERLTVGGRCGLIHMCIDTQDDWERWTSLQVLAVGAFDSPTDLMGLPNIISKVKRGGHPIRKLMLPKVVLHLDDVAELRKLVEVEDFSIDLPNPFGKSLTILEDLL